MNMREFFENLKKLCEDEGDYPICINYKFIEMYPIAGIVLRNDGIVSIFTFPANNAPYTTARVFFEKDVKGFKEKLTEKELEKDVTVRIVTKNDDFKIEKVDIANHRVCVEIKDLLGDNPMKLPPLLLAANNGDIQKVKELIDSGADVTQTLDNGATALHFASSNGNVQIMKILIEKEKSLLYLTHKDGSTALHWAARKGKLEAVNLLIELGSIIDEKSILPPYYTPLQEAKARNHTEVATAIQNKLNQMQRS